MDILTNPTSNASSPAAVASAATDTGTALASDFETFLKMLTAQARYQDPLEPIDSSEYASQLASFSSVEQQVKSNQLLESLVSQMGSSNLAQFAGWIGMEARSTAPTFFDGTAITVTPKISSVAEEANLLVYDSNNTEVQRIPIGTSADPIDWTGIQDNGTSFANGQYSFKIESLAQGEVVDVTTAETYTRVTEARQVGGQTQLILEGGAQVSAAEILALRQPG